LATKVVASLINGETVVQNYQELPSLSNGSRKLATSSIGIGSQRISSTDTCDNRNDEVEPLPSLQAFLVIGFASVMSWGILIAILLQLSEVRPNHLPLY
jgi:hypothetical protein